MTNNNSPEEFVILQETTGQVRKAQKRLQRGKATGEDKVRKYLRKDGGEIVLEKLVTLYTKLLLTVLVSEPWKNVNFILVHKRRKRVEKLQAGQLTVRSLQSIYEQFR